MLRPSSAPLAASRGQFVSPARRTPFSCPDLLTKSADSSRGLAGRFCLDSARLAGPNRLPIEQKTATPRRRAFCSSQQGFEQNEDIKSDARESGYNHKQVAQATAAAKAIRFMGIPRPIDWPRQLFVRPMGSSAAFQQFGWTNRTAHQVVVWRRLAVRSGAFVGVVCTPREGESIRGGGPDVCIWRAAAPARARCALEKGCGGGGGAQGSPAAGWLAGSRAAQQQGGVRASE